MKAQFTLNNLRVSISPKSTRLIAPYKVGDSFELIGENIFLPAGQGFSLYGLATLLPLLPAKQRALDPSDWMNSDHEVLYPDPHCHIVYEIQVTGRSTFLREETTLNPLPHSL